MAGPELNPSDDERRAASEAAVIEEARRITHDFGNLLTRIVGYAELAERLMARGMPAAAEVAEIRAAAEEAVRLTRQLADTQAEGGSVAIDSSSTDATEVLIAVEPALRTLAGGSSRLVVHASEPAPVAIDRSSLEHILRNLVVNAGDAISDTGASDGTGRIEVAVIPAREPTDRTIIRVTDNGPGMEAHVLRRCRDGGFTTRAHNGGTGQGLAMVDRLIRVAGGTLDIASRRGSGTEVTISLPPLDVTKDRGSTR